MAKKTLSKKNKTTIKPADLTNMDKVVRGKMPALENINDTFTRELKRSLSHYTKEIISTSLIKSELLKKEAFFTTLPVPSCIGVFKIPELFGSGLLIFESQLVYGLLNSLYGGKKKPFPWAKDKEFTKIEISTMTTLTQSILKDLEHAWANVHPLTFVFNRFETTPQLIGLAQPTDLILSTVFEVEGESIKGIFTIVIPYKTFDLIKDKLKSKTF